VSADFEDLLSGQGFNAHKDKKGPKTIAEMRKEEMAKEMDPEKLKVSDILVHSYNHSMRLSFSSCWRLLEALPLKGGAGSKPPAIPCERQLGKSGRSCRASSSPPVLALDLMCSLSSIARGLWDPAVSHACFP